MKKLTKSTIPSGHTKNDFKCFGPPAIRDGEFSNTMLCDMGCFKQGEVDSNKYYHGAVVQSTIDSEWYVYVEYGRTGSTTRPQFQFIGFSSKGAAEAYYQKQMHTKNDKRGMWVNHPTLGKILQPKPKKDCYLVRPQTTRCTGLPDAQTITVTPQKVEVKSVKSSSKSDFDPESEKLLKDLNIGTLQYARSSIVNEALPTLDTIEECRKICAEATNLCNNLSDERRILQSGDLTDLTNMIYGRIPKKKGRKIEKSDWLLTPDNIAGWQQDLDAFESALKTQGTTTFTQDYPFMLEYVSLTGELGRFLKDWFMKASRNAHSYIRDKVAVKNIWKITKDSDWLRFDKYHRSVSKGSSREKPLHQTARTDIDEPYRKTYNSSGTWMLFHGTRTVNVSGILRESLRLPRQLSGVAITGAMFGSGLYWADDYKKALGYTSYKGSYWSRGSGSVKGRDSFMFIGDICLGSPWIAPRAGGYKGPPSGHHSIFGKAGHSGVQNNEFIVFDPASIYLRYLVEFG